MRRADRDAASPALGSCAWAVVAFLLLPLIVVIPISFSASSLLRFPPPAYSLRWYQSFLDDRLWIEAALNSLQVGAVTALVSVALATTTAYALARGTFRGKALIQAVILSPLLVPIIVIAVALYYLFSFLRLNGTFAGLVIGHTVITFPYAVVVISASLERFDFRLERIAISLGAPPWRAFLRVTLPVIRPGILVAALFAFLISFDEVVVALFVTGPETITLPKKIWDGIRFELSPVIAAVSTILIVLSWLVITAAALLRRRVPA
jgi:putative spermidine/putrescine transport system permease protein